MPDPALISISERVESYVQMVTAHLARKKGDEYACRRVVERLAIVLQEMSDRTNPKTLAELLEYLPPRN